MKDKNLTPVEGSVLQSTSTRKRRKNIVETGPLNFKKIPGYHTHLVLMDDPKQIGRVTRLQEDLAYDPVKPEEIGIDSTESIVTCPAGQGMNYILMKTPLEEYEKGQKELEDYTKSLTDERMKNSNTPGETTISSTTYST